MMIITVKKLEKDLSSLRAGNLVSSPKQCNLTFS